MELRSGSHAEHCTTWLKVSGSFQPTVRRLGAALEQTTVSLAFSLDGQAPTQQQVFAFLPLRSYGLKFILQVSQAPGPGGCTVYSIGMPLWHGELCSVQGQCRTYYASFTTWPLAVPSCL